MGTITALLSRTVCKRPAKTFTAHLYLTRQLQSANGRINNTKEPALLPATINSKTKSLTARKTFSSCTPTKTFCSPVLAMTTTQRSSTATTCRWMMGTRSTSITTSLPKKLATRGLVTLSLSISISLLRKSIRSVVLKLVPIAKKMGLLRMEQLERRNSILMLVANSRPEAKSIPEVATDRPEKLLFMTYFTYLFYTI